MKYLIIQLFSFICIAIGVTAFIGHLSNTEWLYRWNKETGMAINASIIFIINGISIFLIGEELKKKHEQ